MPSKKEVLFQKLEEKEREIIEFIQKLVQAPSQCGINNEEDVACLIDSKLKSFGLTPKLVYHKKNRPSIICNCNESPHDKKLLLNASLDTAVVGDEKSWKYPPFSGKIIRGKLYGRGAADTKAALAIYSYIAGITTNSPLKFKDQLTLAFDSEEHFWNRGLRNLIKKGLWANVCFLGYNGMDEIIVGGRGLFDLELISLGKSVHTGSRTKRGINAIKNMAKVLTALDTDTLSYKENPLFWFGPKLTVTHIKGGKGKSLVPDECSAHLDIRVVPSQAKESILADLEKVIEKLKKDNEELKIKIKPLKFIPPYQTSKNEKIVQFLKKNADEILQQETKLSATGPASNGNVLAEAGIKVVGGFGVKGENVHAANEYIEVDSVLPVAKIYLATILDYLGTHP